MLLRVVAPHFVAGVIIRYSTVVKAAPILRWSFGRDLQWFKAYCERKGWQIERLREGTPIEQYNCQHPNKLNPPAKKSKNKG